MPSGGRGVLAIAAAIGVAFGGCGDPEERIFTAPEMVEELNALGAGLELGEPLASVAPGIEVFVVTLEEGESEGDEEAPAAGEHLHEGGGSLVVAADAAAARAEHERCERALTLLCYRAANVVLRFEESLDQAEQDRIAAALTALAAG